MNHVTRLAILGTLAMAGCSTPAPSSEENASSESADLQSEHGRDPLSHATLTEAVQDYQTHAPKAGVSVCAQEVNGHGDQGAGDDDDDDDGTQATCGLTGADGTVTLSVHNRKDVRVTFSVDGYVSANQLLRIRGDVSTGTRMIATALAGQLAQFLGSVLDLTKAQPVFTTYDPAEHPLAGVATTMTPASGISYYVATNGAPSHALTATTAAGIGGVLNADVGSAIVQATPPAGMHCDIGPYVPGPTPNSIRVEALAGSAGEAAFHCQ